MKGTALRQSFAKGGKRRKAAMHLIPNLFTTGNLFCGVFAILSVFNANYLAAAVAILVAMVFDVLDGKSARMTNSTSHFGLEYDSLSDVVSFGVAPGLLLYSWALSGQGTFGVAVMFAYVAMGAVGVRQPIADYFREKVFQGGLTYNSHPLGCAAALATLRVYEEDDLIGNAKRLGPVMALLLDELARKHPCIGAHRSIGLFGLVELVKDPRTKEPLAPFGQSSAATRRLTTLLREEGLYTFVRWHTFFTNPPLCITEAQLREGFLMIDRALTRLTSEKTEG
jgi:hypothetical protein